MLGRREWPQEQSIGLDVGDLEPTFGGIVQKQKLDGGKRGKNDPGGSGGTGWRSLSMTLFPLTFSFQDRVLSGRMDDRKMVKDLTTRLRNREFICPVWRSH